MSVECIHGLDKPLCDICSPPEAPAAPAKTARVARTAAPRSSLRSTPSAAAPTARKPTLVNADEQRIYHVTHLSNLAAIVADGGLVAEAAAEPGSEPAVSLSSAEWRSERRSAAVSGEPGDVAASYVPFAVTPDASFWQAFRVGDEDPRLSRETLRLPASEFVILVSTIGKAGQENAVLAMGDAGSAATRFAATPETLRRALGTLRNDEELLTEAELLVHDRLPFEAVTLIGVANDKTRDEVRELLRGATHGPKVAVYPPWFTRP